MYIIRESTDEDIRIGKCRGECKVKSIDEDIGIGIGKAIGIDEDISISKYS